MPDRDTGRPLGPYETSEEVRLLPPVRAVYDAMRATPQRGAGTVECERLILGACGRAGVALGAYDARIVRWLANWEPETCQVVAALIERAGQPERGAVTEWGACRRGEAEPFTSSMDEAAIRRLAEDLPGVVTGLVRREVTPWRPADEPATGEKGEGDG